MILGTFRGSGNLQTRLARIANSCGREVKGKIDSDSRNQVDLRSSISTRIRGFRVDQRGDSYSKNYVGAVNTWSDRNRSTSWIGVTVTTCSFRLKQIRKKNMIFWESCGFLKSETSTENGDHYLFTKESFRRKICNGMVWFSNVFSIFLRAPTFWSKFLEISCEE